MASQGALHLNDLHPSLLKEKHVAFVPTFPPSSLGQQLDEFLQLAVDKVEAGLGSGPCRTQAFTLLLWVRSWNGFWLERDNYVWLNKIFPFDLEP